MSLDYKEFSHELNGLWVSVLAEFGIDVGNFKGLNTKNSSCPLCGGDDRAHWREQAGRIALYCRNCTDGSMKSPEDVIMESTGINFNDLVIQLSNFVNHTPLEVLNKAKQVRSAKPTTNMPLDHKQDHELCEKFLKLCEICHSMDLLGKNAPNPQKMPTRNNVDYWTIENEAGIIVNLAKYDDDKLQFIAQGQSYNCLHTIYGGRREIIIVDPIDGILCWYKTKATIHIAFTLENLRYTMRHRVNFNPVVVVRTSKQFNEFKDSYDVRIIIGEPYGKVELLKELP